MYGTVDTFEAGATWITRNNAGTPTQDCTTAATGTCSLNFNPPNGMNFDECNYRPEAAANVRQGMAFGGYSTATYPWMCMSYKIPATTVCNMLLAWGVYYYASTAWKWRSVAMTQGTTLTTYASVASWLPLTTDNNWHYKCINLGDQLELSMGFTFGPGPWSIIGVLMFDGNAGGANLMSGSFNIGG